MDIKYEYVIDTLQILWWYWPHVQAYRLPYSPNRNKTVTNIDTIGAKISGGTIPGRDISAALEVLVADALSSKGAQANCFYLLGFCFFSYHLGNNDFRLDTKH